MVNYSGSSQVTQNLQVTSHEESFPKFTYEQITHHENIPVRPSKRALERFVEIFIIRFVGTLKDGPRRLALTRWEHGTCEVHSDGWNVLHMTHMVLMTGVKAWKRAVM